MGFLAPSLLFALAAAVVPYLVHRIGRRQPVAVRFAAMQLLLRAERQIRARTRLREILLLLARTTVAAALPLVFARPFVERVSEAPLAALTQQSAVLVLDDSASMRRRAGRDTPWAAAIDKARAIVRQLPSGSAMALVLASTGGGAPVSALTLEKSRLEDTLDRQRCSARPADFAEALRRAATILHDAPHPDRRIYVLTDLQAAGWESATGAAALPGGDQAPAITVIDLAEGRTFHNRAVIALHAAAAPELGPGGVVIATELADFGGAAPAQVGVTLSIDGQVVTKGFVDLPAGGRARKSFSHVLDARDDSGGVHTVRVAIDGDDFPLDDRRDTALALTRALRILVVNGDARTEKTEDEVFFLESALAQIGGGVSVTPVSPDDVPLTDLQRFSVIFVANLDVPTGALASALGDFVAHGGGLFLSLGARVNAEAWNTAFGPWLPQPLGLVRTAAQTPSAGEVHDDRPAERLAPIDRSHPMLATFSAEAQGLASALFYQYYLLEPVPESADRSVILRFETGAPALVERVFPRAGAPAINARTAAPGGDHGRVMLLATSIDREWTDLPIRPGFLPLIVEATRRLAGAPSSDTSGAILVGATRTVGLPGDRLRLEISKPDGGVWVYRRRPRDPAPTVSFAETDEPGFYGVRAAGADNTMADLAEENFAVNLDPRESDTRRLPAAQRPGQDPHSASGDAPKQKDPLWHGLAMLIVFLVLFESVISLRGRGRPLST